MFDANNDAPTGIQCIERLAKKYPLAESPLLFIDDWRFPSLEPKVFIIRRALQIVKLFQSLTHIPTPMMDKKYPAMTTKSITFNFPSYSASFPDVDIVMPSLYFLSQMPTVSSQFRISRVFTKLYKAHFICFNCALYKFFLISFLNHVRRRADTWFIQREFCTGWVRFDLNQSDICEDRVRLSKSLLESLLFFNIRDLLFRRTGKPYRNKDTRALVKAVQTISNHFKISHFLRWFETPLAKLRCGGNYHQIKGVDRMSWLRLHGYQWWLFVCK